MNTTKGEFMKRRNKLQRYIAEFENLKAQSISQIASIEDNEERIRMIKGCQAVDRLMERYSKEEHDLTLMLQTFYNEED